MEEIYKRKYLKYKAKIKNLLLARGGNLENNGILSETPVSENNANKVVIPPPVSVDNVLPPVTNNSINPISNVFIPSSQVPSPETESLSEMVSKDLDRLSNLIKNADCKKKSNGNSNLVIADPTATDSKLSVDTIIEKDLKSLDAMMNA